MAKAARKDDKVSGPPTGSHNGSHNNGAIDPNSKITDCSNSTVYINGKLAATQGDSANVSDNCDNGAFTPSIIIEGSSTVYINGNPVAREGDKLTSHHNSQIEIIEGSDNVEIG